MNDILPLLALRDWDTEQFGFRVAEIPAGAGGAALCAALEHAQREGIRLVYWRAGPDCIPPADLLRTYRGALVDHKTTFERALTPAKAESPLDVPGFQITEFPMGPASPELVALAIDAGQFSRFRRDERFPQRAFKRMYETWINRSTSREIASTVLTALADDRHVAGMVTIAERDDEAAIGLLAVAAADRGRGLGTLLVREAHRWMSSRPGIARATVVTQQENTAACGLYTRCGYRVREVRPFYHFWPK